MPTLSAQPPPMDALAEPLPSIDEIEAAMIHSGGPVPELHVEHRFTPGLYIRIFHIPAGVMVSSMTHKTEHPFVLTEGILHLIGEEAEPITLRAPFHGITKPGTRRLAYAETDCVWTTYHVTDETDVEKIGEQILEPNSNPLIPPGTGEGWRHSIPRLDS